MHFDETQTLNSCALQINVLMKRKVFLNDSQGDNVSSELTTVAFCICS